MAFLLKRKFEPSNLIAESIKENEKRNIAVLKPNQDPEELLSRFRGWRIRFLTRTFRWSKRKPSV